MKIGINEQIKCVNREIAMRERVYPRRVAEGRLPQKAADYQLAAMRAVLETLESVSNSQVKKAELLLFGADETGANNPNTYGSD